jgi:uncharacterized protein with LGFP repeats
MRRFIIFVFGLSMLLPGTAFAQPVDGLTLPGTDAALAYVAPTADQPNYSTRVALFVEATVPEPFKSAFDAAGGADSLGLPTSRPTADPNNRNFVYQRFEHGVLFYNATEGTTDQIV